MSQNNNKTTASKKYDAFAASSVLDSIAIATFAIDVDHKITHWNRALEKASGLLAKDMIGTKDQWKPFYLNPRPTMSDLIIESAKDESVERFYTNKFHKSNVLENAYEAEDFFPAMGSGEWLSFTAAPILDFDGNIIGAVETLTIISDRKNAEQKLIISQQKYRELSTLDDLTKLFNPRHFFSKIEEEIDRCNRYNQALSICMFDLDNFKRVNDAYGHQFGNLVLAEFAKVIQTNIRQVDMAFRYGGEEFIILFPFVIAHRAAIVVEKIRHQFEQINFKADNDVVVNVTTSAGLTTYCSKENTDSLIKRVDKAMYQSKSSGKNKVTIVD